MVMRSLLLLGGIGIGYTLGYTAKSVSDLDRNVALHASIAKLANENVQMARTLASLDRIITSSQQPIEDAFILCGGVASMMPVPPAEGRGRRKK